MARKVGHVPTSAVTPAAVITVPNEVKQEAAELYAYLTANPSEEGFVEFEAFLTDDNGKIITDKDGNGTLDEKAVKKELNEWLRWMRIYSVQNQIRFRQLPSNHLGVNQVRFSMTPEPTEEEKAAAKKAAEDKAAAKAAKAAEAAKVTK